jgi:hypothetical protein
MPSARDDRKKEVLHSSQKQKKPRRILPHVQGKDVLGEGRDRKVKDP